MLLHYSNNLNATQIYDKYLNPKFRSEIFNFYYNRQGWSSTQHDANKHFSDTTNGITVINSNGSDTNTFRWNQITKGANSSSGYITLIVLYSVWVKQLQIV